MSRFLTAVAFLVTLSGCATVSPEKQRELDETFVLPKTNKVTLISCYWTQANNFSNQIMVPEKDFTNQHFGNELIPMTKSFYNQFVKHLTNNGYDITTSGGLDKCNVTPDKGKINIYIMNKSVSGLFSWNNALYVEIFLTQTGAISSAKFVEFIAGVGGVGPEKAAKVLFEGIIKKIKMAQSNQ